MLAVQILEGCVVWEGAEAEVDGRGPDDEALGPCPPARAAWQDARAVVPVAPVRRRPEMTAAARRCAGSGPSQLKAEGTPPTRPRTTTAAASYTAAPNGRRRLDADACGQRAQARLHEGRTAEARRPQPRHRVGPGNVKPLLRRASAFLSQADRQGTATTRRCSSNRPQPQPGQQPPSSARPEPPASGGAIGPAVTTRATSTSTSCWAFVDANAATIKAQYRRLALRHHPDKTQSSDEQKAEAELVFRRVNFANSLLADPIKRRTMSAERFETS